jgi:hypothetical protein
MNPLIRQQIDNNVACRDRWDLFRAHRDRVTGLLCGAAPAGRLCVLGAGNANDLDLAGLLGTYREVHLVDLDADAMALGVARQGLARNPAIHLHGDVDLTGVIGRMTAWSANGDLSDEELAACAGRPLSHVRPLLPGPFDVAASTCLLSQIVNCAVRTVGDRHPQFLAALQALRVGHLRLLVDLVAPGGAGLLMTDIVSSDTAPSLASVPDAHLPAVVARLVAERNFFHGVNPAVLVSLFRDDPFLASQAVAVEGLRPWLWDFGPRTYLVCALRFRKRASAGA